MYAELYQATRVMSVNSYARLVQQTLKLNHN